MATRVREGPTRDGPGRTGEGLVEVCPGARRGARRARTAHFRTRLATNYGGVWGRGASTCRTSTGPRTARAATSSPDDLFVEGAAQRGRARGVRCACPVRFECLVDALDHRIAFGVWGGMTERERRALLRRVPDVDSWREVLEADPELALVAGPDRCRRRRRAGVAHGG